MTKANFSLSLDSELKEQAEAVFDRLGLTLPDAIELFLQATVEQQALPLKTSVHALRITPPNCVVLNARQSRQFCNMLESEEFDEPFFRLMKYYESFPNLKR